MEHTINLQTIIANRNYPEAGNILFDILEKSIASEDTIILDAGGVAALPTMFLNTSIGRFIETHGVDLLRQKVSFAKITATQAERIKDYIDRVLSK